MMTLKLKYFFVSLLAPPTSTTYVNYSNHVM